MGGPVFVDTNVFVYARDSSEPEKHSRAVAWLNALWASRLGRTSFQVLNQYYVTVTQKLAHALPPQEARDDVRDLLTWRPVSQDANVLTDAWHVQDRLGFTWWDSLVVAAARACNAEVLLTEDLQHGQVIDGLRVLSPFEIEPEELHGEALGDR